MTRRIDQFLAGFGDGDAISHEAVALRRSFCELGFASEIYADMPYVSPSLKNQCLDYRGYDGAEHDIVIYHMAIASPVAAYFRQAPGQKVMIYHNITPSEYFRPFATSIAERLDAARADLVALRDVPAAVWADSSFNAQELRAIGYRQVTNFSLLFNPATLDYPTDQRIAAKMRPRMTTLLFVGRLAPNKKVERLLEMFYYYRQLDPASRLVVVGSSHGCPRYFSMLQLYAADLGLANVCFEEFAAPSELPTYYRSADVFVTASEHEGFCLPLLEAMAMDCPVVARSTGATPETCGGGGVLYSDLTAAELAVLVRGVANDQTWRREILTAQAQRLAILRQRDVGGELRRMLAR